MLERRGFITGDCEDKRIFKIGLLKAAIKKAGLMEEEFSRLLK
ncbi:MAG: hypothetical protein U9N01_03400 [Euryarchaeota archaeon]|nr:hypothetical protein [Euryarchaeota archaeon]